MQLRNTFLLMLNSWQNLFYQIGSQVNGKDYSVEQLNAWANGKKKQEWNRSFLEYYPVVAVKKDRIVGGGRPIGYLTGCMFIRATKRGDCLGDLTNRSSMKESRKLDRTRLLRQTLFGNTGDTG